MDRTRRMDVDGCQMEWGRMLDEMGMDVKQVYVGLHHLVQILYCNQTLCVCVCMLPRPKAGSKTNFGVARSFLPSNLRNSKFHSL
jgi:hypothetical protein